jgi:hypothetical protein
MAISQPRMARALIRSTTAQKRHASTRPWWAERRLRVLGTVRTHSGEFWALRVSEQATQEMQADIGLLPWVSKRVPRCAHVQRPYPRVKQGSGSCSTLGRLCHSAAWTIDMLISASLRQRSAERGPGFRPASPAVTTYLHTRLLAFQASSSGFLLHRTISTVSPHSHARRLSLARILPRLVSLQPHIGEQPHDLINPIR